MKTKSAFIISFLLIAAGVLLVNAQPGIDVPDFQRLFLNNPDPIVRLHDEMDDVSAWELFTSEGSTGRISRGEGKEGGSLCLQYNLSGHQDFCALKKQAKPFSVSERVGIRIRLRGANPGNVVDVKVVDKDGGYFGVLGLTNTGESDWAEIVLRPDDLRYLWGGEDMRLDEIHFYEIAVAANYATGPGELYVDDYQITEQTDSYIELALSQVGYHPEDSKHAVLRLVGEPPADEFGFEIVDEDTGSTVLKGVMKEQAFSIWSGKYYTGDFSALAAPGTYRLRVRAAEADLDSSPFQIGQKVLQEKVTPAVISFLRFMHCGFKCHPNDPIIGGYHDTFYDVGNRMWSLTHMIAGLAMTVEHGGVGDWDRNRLDESLDELLYALSFALRAQLPDGGVGHAGIGHTGHVDNSKYRFEEDTHPRVLDKYSAVVPTYYYVGAMCRAYPVICEKYPAVAAEVLKAAKAAAGFLLNRERGFRTAHEHGGFIYAMTEMYRLTGDSKYLEGIPRHLDLVAKLQDLDSGNKEIAVCGDFFLSRDERNFTYQYKFHELNLAILLGFANIVELYEPSSPEWLHAAYMLEVFHQCYLKPMSSLTPYRQIAHGLEREGDGYRVAQFSPPDHPWVGAHGLNVDHFAYGYLAMRTGYLFEDLWCERFADDQMQWVLGANPLRYSMVCGVGANNPVVWSSMHGKEGPVDGGIPNGLVGDRLRFPIWLVVFSSGEYWLPHNDWYLILSSVLDRPGVIEGLVANNPPSGQVEIYAGAEKIWAGPVGGEGKFGPVEVAPQKEYRIRYEGEKVWAERKVLLLAGEREKVLLDPQASYDVRLSCARKDGERAEIGIVVENGCGQEVFPELSVRVFDGVEGQEEELKVSVPAGEKTHLKREYVFREGRPLLVAVGRNALLVPYR